MNNLSVVITCCLIGFCLKSSLQPIAFLLLPASSIFSKAEHLVCIPCSKCCHYYTFYLPHSLLRKELPTIMLFMAVMKSPNLYQPYFGRLSVRIKLILLYRENDEFLNQHCSVFALLAPLTCFVLVSDIPGAPTAYKIAGSVRPSS